MSGSLTLLQYGALKTIHRPNRSTQKTGLRVQTRSFSVLTTSSSVVRNNARGQRQRMVRAYGKPGMEQDSTGPRCAAASKAVGFPFQINLFWLADTPLVPASQLMNLVVKKIAQHAVAVGLSAALLATCLSAQASELMR